MLFEPMIFEEWKPINFFEIKHGAYFISSFGRVYSCLKFGFLSPALSNGYLTVQLNLENGSRRTFYIHRLVAMAFVENENPDNMIEVNHKNLKRSDCFYQNLEWTTKADNIRHEVSNKNHGVHQDFANKTWGGKTYGESNGMNKWKESQVRTMLSVLENGGSREEALSAANIEIEPNSRMNLSHIIRGHRWRHVREQYILPPNA